MNNKASIWRSVPILLTFFILAALFYCIGYWLIFRLERATPLMMSVGLAAIATCLIYQRPLSSLGLSWGSNRWQWVSFVIPLGIALFSYLLIWGAGFAEFSVGFASSLRTTYNLVNWGDVSIILLHIILSATISLFLSLPSILGEEIAWRGFLFAEFSRFMSFGGVALTTGVLWSMFHWPIMIKGFYGSEYTPFLFQLGLFSLFIISNSVTMTYLRYKTDSVWSAVLFHASSNIFIQKVFTPLTVVDKNSSWYVDEFGLVIPIVAMLVALYFWIRASKEFA